MKKNPYVRYWTVEGRTGHEWKVSQRADGSFACACPRWIFSSCICGHKRGEHPNTSCRQCDCDQYVRPDCHHIRYVIEQLGAQPVLSPKELRPNDLNRYLAAKARSEAKRIAAERAASIPLEIITRPITDRPIRKFRADFE